ncbi:MAG: hypothetical protein HY821_21370 [Acidobacteria bacterium]|nr:hypothetical protein [Acidobacteriota bacterium]
MKYGICVALGAVALGLMGCGSEEKKAPANTTPIGELIQAGKGPLVVSELRPSGNMVVAKFKVSVENVSDSHVDLMSGVALYYDEKGAYIKDSKREMGYAEMGGIAPGEKIELETMAGLENARKGKVILEKVVYKKDVGMQGMGPIAMKWTNPKFAAEVAAAEGGQ